jgi:hypothetical protein
MQGTSIPLNRKDHILELRKAESRTHCQTEIKDYVACANGRTVSVVWYCRAQNSLMSKCLYKHMPSEEAVAYKLDHPETATVVSVECVLCVGGWDAWV